MVLLEACSIVAVTSTPKDRLLPDAIAIAIASTEEEARKHAEKELAPYLSGEGRKANVVYVGQILHAEEKAIIYLYTSRAGRIK